MIDLLSSLFLKNPLQNGPKWSASIERLTVSSRFNIHYFNSLGMIQYHVNWLTFKNAFILVEPRITHTAFMKFKPFINAMRQEENSDNPICSIFNIPKPNFISYSVFLIYILM